MYYYYPVKFRGSYRLAVIEVEENGVVVEHEGRNREQSLSSILSELRVIREKKKFYNRQYRTYRYNVTPVSYPQKSERFMTLLLRAKCGGIK